jgi:hypothetical protein
MGMVALYLDRLIAVGYYTLFCFAPDTLLRIFVLPWLSARFVGGFFVVFTV